MLGTITLTVGQPDGVSVAQKEEAPETMETIQDEVAPQVNGEKVEKEPTDANDISPVEEKAAEEKPGDANEVGFKKIFRFVGFKFTLKKDKSEEKDPVKLLNIKDKDGDAVVDEAVNEEEAATVEEKSTVEEKEGDSAAEVSKDDEKTEDAEGKTEAAEGEAAEEEKTEKEEETSPAQEVISPFRKIFSGGLFSNLRKKASIKKTKEEEVKEEAPKAEETEAAVEEVKAETKEEAPEEEAKSEAAPASEEEKPKEEATTEEVKEPATEEVTPEAAAEGEVTAEVSAPETDTTEEPKQDEDKAALEVSSEAELLSSQEKVKPHGSPLKKLFTGAGLKKLSTKKQKKEKKEAEPKVVESGEQAEQLQSSTESAEKAKSGPSTPEESGEHVITEVTEKESSQETDGEVTSDGEKKKEGIIAWSSFKKLVTPKRRVKRPSESDDETTAEKPVKSATLSSTESATLADKSVEEETKEEKAPEEEPQTEATEKLSSSTEEKKKMDTSVSWEALMCMGGPKKRTRKTSDSDDDETKVEEEPLATATAEGEEEAKVESALVTSQTSENEGELVSSPETVSPHASAWDTIKRIVMKKSKSEEKPEESADQVLSDSEGPKEESSFFLKKFFPGRRKKKSDKQASAEHGSGEEDSDTPAVVPLSEYDEPAEPEPEKPVEPEIVQTKATAEERSPSWISAAVEDDKLDQLSDIPEEAESAATPKSVDTDIAEDEEQAPVSPKPTPGGRRLSLAEVKPLDPATSSETAALPNGPETVNAQELLQGIEAESTEIPAETSVAVEDVPIETATETTEHEPEMETAETKTNAVLEMHGQDEAMAICTGLGSMEIPNVALEKPASLITESVTVVRDACVTEVSMEEKPAVAEEATMSEDLVLEAQIHQVDTTELEALVEKTPNSIADIQVATESIEPPVQKAGIVNTELEGSEVAPPPTDGENSPQAVVIDAIEATSEAAVCTQSVEVSEPTIETKAVSLDMEQQVATEENTPVEEVVQAVTKEITSTIGDSVMTTSEETEPKIPLVLASSEDVPVITETVVLVAPVPEDVSTPEPIVVETSEAVVEVAEPEISAEVEQAIEKETEEETIESQSMEIAKNVIQEAMDKVSEEAPEPEKPTTPSSSTPTPDQAVETIEKDVEIESETPVITETPVALVCEKSSPKALHVALEVIDAIALEVTASIDGSEEVEKPEEESKEDEEVKVSESTVAEEEQEEVKEESQKEEPEHSVEEAVAEEKVNDAEAAEEETQSKPLELHIPVQVVLQTAEVIEEPTVEEEAAVEFDSNGPVDAPVQEEVKTNGETTEEQVSERLSTLTEEPQEAEAAADSQSDAEKPSGKCAEVMAQVIEVIEEAVKEIEPVSTEITAAS